MRVHTATAEEPKSLVRGVSSPTLYCGRRVLLASSMGLRGGKALGASAAGPTPAMRSRRSIGGKNRLCLSSRDEPTRVMVMAGFYEDCVETALGLGTLPRARHTCTTAVCTGFASHTYGFKDPERGEIPVLMVQCLYS